MTKADKEGQRKAPILRFKGFTDDWEQRELGNIVVFIRNGITIKQDGNFGKPITRIESISEGKLNLNKVGYANITSNVYEDYYLKNNDILFSNINSLNHIGKTSFVHDLSQDVIHGMNLLNIRVDKNHFNSRFVYYQLAIMKSKNLFKKIAKPAVNQASIAVSELKKLSIKTTSIKEQYKIQKLLATLENILTLYERKTKLIKQIQSSFLDKFFFEPNNVTSLNHFLRIRNGYAFKSSKLTENGEIPVVRISNIGNDKSFAFTTKEKNKEQFALYPNDIVIALSGATAGKINQVSNKYPLYYQNQRVGFFERKNDKLDYEYLNSFLHSKKFKSQLQKTLVAGAQPNIAPKDIEKIKIPFIGYKLQQKIGQVNKYLFELQRINKSKFTLLDKIKKTLLNNMFV